MHPEGKYVVDIDAGIDINKCTPGVRVALRNDSYALHLLLPTKVRLGCQLVVGCAVLLPGSVL